MPLKFVNYKERLKNTLIDNPEYEKFAFNLRERREEKNNMKITKEEIEIINDIFGEEEIKELKEKVRKTKLLKEMYIGREELIKRLKEDKNIREVKEIEWGAYKIKPIEYIYKGERISIYIYDEEKIMIEKDKRQKEKEKDIYGCMYYRYKARSMEEVMKAIEEIHKGIDIGII